MSNAHATDPSASPQGESPQFAMATTPAVNLCESPVPSSPAPDNPHTRSVLASRYNVFVPIMPIDPAGLCPQAVVVVPVPLGWAPASKNSPPPALTGVGGFPARAAAAAAIETNRRRIHRARGGKVFAWSCVVRKGNDHTVIVVTYPYGFAPTTADQMPPVAVLLTGRRREQTARLEAINSTLLPLGLYAIRIVNPRSALAFDWPARDGAA